LNYVFMVHWLVFIALGILGCMKLNDLRIFFTTVALLIVADLLAIPAWFYDLYLQSIFIGKPIGLHFGQVSRSNLGYAATLACVVAVTWGVHSQTTRHKALFCVWSTLCGILVYLAGSKGPLLAIVIAMGVLILKTRLVDRMRIAVIVITLASIVSAIVMFNLSLGLMGVRDPRFGPGGSVSYGFSKGRLYQSFPHLSARYITPAPDSYTLRIGFVQGTVQFLMQRELVDFLVGTGFGSSVRIPYHSSQINLPMVNFYRGETLLAQARATASTATTLTVPFPTDATTLVGPLPGLSAGNVTVMVYNQTGPGTIADYSLVGTVSLTVNDTHTTPPAPATGNVSIIKPDHIDLATAPPNFTITGAGFSNLASGALLTHGTSHNLFLDLLVEVGVIGFALFGLMLTLLIRFFFRDLSLIESSERKFLGSIMLCTLLIVLVKANVAAQPYVEDLMALILGVLIGSAVSLQSVASVLSSGSTPLTTTAGN
jgi:hypothetical protein